MATEEIDPGHEGPSGGSSGEKSAGGASTGFFSVYKPKQGKTTRLATGAGAALLVGLTMWFLYNELAAAFPGLKDAQGINKTWWNVTVLVIGFASAVLMWWLVNKPANAEFLIATDSEMKKVTWTSRKQLWGSTKVVILFMLFIAASLFVIDLVFHYLFYFIDVLKVRPIGM